MCMIQAPMASPRLAQGGLCGDHKKPGKEMTSAALRYHTFDEFKNLPQDQQDDELN